MIIQAIKSVIKYNLILPIRRILLGNLVHVAQDWKEIRQYVEWVESVETAPPPAIVKQTTLKEYTNKYRISVFVETGTYLGDMVWVMRDVFTKLYSIEYGSGLYKKAKKRF